MVMPPGQNSDSRLEDLDKRLYERNGNLPSGGRKFLPDIKTDIRKRWEEIPEVSTGSEKIVSMSVIKKILLGSVLFFVAALGIGAYLLWGGSNIFQADNIDIAVSGPASTEGGKELGLQVMVTNRNSTTLDTAEIVVEYPSGTHNPDDITKELTRDRIFVGSIGPGEVVKKNLRSILFGEEGDAKDIKISLEYRTPGSNAIFVKEKDYSIAISSSPITLTLNVPQEVNNGQEMLPVVRVVSNSSTPIQNLLLEVSFPQGFTYRTASPAPAYKNNLWQIGELAPGKIKEIKISGVIEGQHDEVKTFRAAVGLSAQAERDKIATTYSSALERVTIRRPFLGVDVLLNGSSADNFVVDGTQVVRGTINWANNLGDKVRDVQASVVFSGVSLDRTSVSAEDGGFFKSAENAIVWDKKATPELETVDPAGRGQLEFSFSSLPLFAEGQPKIRNPEIKLDLTVSGSRIVPGRQVEQIETKITRTVRVATALQLASRAVYSTGPFTNTGPLPPTSEQQTTYTVIWSVTNSSNDVSGATVESTLPSYMKWLGVVSPGSENVKYDASAGKVIWNLGSIGAGTGVSSSAREVAFQVALVPSITQEGTAPVLISDTVLEGTDDFTRTVVKSVRRALTTRITADPSFRQGDDIVTPSALNPQ